VIKENETPTFGLLAVQAQFEIVLSAI